MRRMMAAALLAVLLPGGLVTVGAQPAQAYGPCTGSETIEGAALPKPMPCYMGPGAGAKSAVEALQKAIVLCYSSTAAARYVINSGGFDGAYGPGTVSAVKWLQSNRFGFTGSDVDGVFGPASDRKMRYPFDYGCARIPY
ncbi:peptidoglycan-binding domain-containing protein [Nocardioides sp. NPDC057577]|uniref:peptidoglycan-binding domain-containing protein n=1 Tax=Nocardioides sp. NPDC057577 TaxID=3346171 RepID=UPI00366EB0EF